LFTFVIRIYHDAQSSECQNKMIVKDNMCHFNKKKDIGISSDNFIINWDMPG